MKIERLMDQIDLSLFNEKMYNELKIQKSKLSNRDKKYILKVLANSKWETKETVLKAIICFAIWEPNEAISQARRKGILRYKVFGDKGKNKARYYLEYLISKKEVLGFSEKNNKYLKQKYELEWLESFYNKTEEKIDTEIANHYQGRIRKRIKGINFESSLHKELLAYIDMLFFLERQTQTRYDYNILSTFSQEEIAEGVSYLLYKYIEKYGISTEKNYCVDASYINSDRIEKLILFACQINYVLELELLIDFYDYDIRNEGNCIILRSKDETLEKSIQLGYIKQEMQKRLFFAKRYSRHGKEVCLETSSELIADKLGDKIYKRISNGILTRYRFEIPTVLLEKMAEQKGGGKVQLFLEESLELKHFSKEMCMNMNELYEKKVTQNCNAYDILLCQRFFRMMYYIQKYVYQNEKDTKVILQSLIPSMDKENLKAMIFMLLKNQQKVDEVYDLLSYNIDYKFDIQYTPFLEVGSKVIFPISVLSCSNLMRNTIAYSYLSKNEIVNDDGGAEPLVKMCENCFRQCSYKYEIFTNKKFKYKGKKGEIDVLVVSDSDLIIIECKGPLVPTSNFEMRATFEHIEKSQKQLDLSKKAFEDDGFRNKFFRDSLQIDGKRRNVYTCTILGHRLFSIWSGVRHPIRNIHELDMILNNGEISSTFAKWSIWKEQKYSHADLLDFLSQDGVFIKIMQDSMENYSNKLTFAGKTLQYESYMWNMRKLFLLCDNKLRLVEKNQEKWNVFLKTSEEQMNTINLKQENEELFF